MRVLFHFFSLLFRYY